MAALLLIISALAAPPALAKAACNSGPTAGTADIVLVQAVSVATNGDYVDHLTITNFGPCNVPSAGLTATLSSNLVAYSSNPNSWICSGIGTTSVSCSETSTIGVPGTADIYLEYAPGTIVACAATFDIPEHLASCPSSGGTVSDPNTSNNTVAGGLLEAGQTLTYGPNGKPLPTSFFTHTTGITLANGGLVNSISQTEGCPPGVPTCFLGTATITLDSSVSGQKTWTLTFLASLTKKPLSQITVWNSDSVSNGYIALSNCSGTHPTDPCVSSRSKSTNSAGETIYTIVVRGTQDNGMTAD